MGVEHLYLQLLRHNFGIWLTHADPSICVCETQPSRGMTNTPRLLQLHRTLFISAIIYVGATIESHGVMNNYGARFGTTRISMSICLVMGIEEAAARMRKQTFSSERKMRFHFRHGAFRKAAVKVGCHWRELECTSTSQKIKKTCISSHFVLSFFYYPHPIAYQTCFFYAILCILLRNPSCIGRGESLALSVTWTENKRLEAVLECFMLSKLPCSDDTPRCAVVPTLAIEKSDINWSYSNFSSLWRRRSFIFSCLWFRQPWGAVLL